jgi:hypothetical protein
VGVRIRHAEDLRVYGRDPWRCFAGWPTNAISGRRSSGHRDSFVVSGRIRDVRCREDFW